MRKAALLLVGICLLSYPLRSGAQTPFHEMAKDTIVTVKGFPADVYLLDGKRLNLPVMVWFMSDVPAAKEEIRVATFTDQLSLAGYSVGGVFGFSGLLVGQQDRRLGRELLTLGAVGLGAGLCFQVLSGIFKRRAVRLYNREVRRIYGDPLPGMSAGGHFRSSRQ